MSRFFFIQVFYQFVCRPTIGYKGFGLKEVALLNNKLSSEIRTSNVK
jgi:hypothetical protein